MKLKSKENKLLTLDPIAFWIGLISISFFILFGVMNQQAFGAFLSSSLDIMCTRVGWLFLLMAVVCIIVVFILCFSKIGNIRIGGVDAKPVYSNWQWFSMSLCGCIGTGILFWAMGEPMFHFMTPPVAAGVIAGSREAAIFSLSQTIWHWTIPQYAIYTICGVAVAISSFNYKRNLSFGQLYENVFGPNKTVVSIIHAISIFCLCGSTACSMGAGLLQIGGGVHALTGIKPGPAVWGIASALIIAIYTVSSILGLKKGMARLSSLCTVIFFGMLAYTLFCGPTQFILDLGVESIGELMDSMFKRTTMLATMAPGDTWSRDFLIQYIASFFVVGPVLGMFLSRLGKGRTIRQFVLVNVFAPSIFCTIWIIIFGGTAIGLQATGQFDVWAAVTEQGLESTIFAILGTFPFSKVIIAVFVVAVFTSFTTMADPITSALATISVKGLQVSDEAPTKLKTVWGVCVGTVAFLVVASGGITSIKGLFTIVGLPIMILVVVFILSCFKQGNQLVENGGEVPTEEMDVGNLE